MLMQVAYQINVLSCGYIKIFDEGFSFYRKPVSSSDVGPYSNKYVEMLIEEVTLIAKQFFR